MKRLTAGVAVLIVLVFAASGCGSSKPSASDQTKAWANGVCTAVTTWKNQMSKLAGSVKSLTASPDALKTTLTSAESITKTFTSTLKGLGKPNTTAGAQAKQSLDALATQLSKDVTTIQNAVNSAGSAPAIGAAVGAIATAAASMKTATQSTVQQLQQLDAKGELSQAFKSASACSPYTGS